jgi:hypothetical protein
VIYRTQHTRVSLSLYAIGLLTAATVLALPGANQSWAIKRRPAVTALVG